MKESIVAPELFLGRRTWTRRGEVLQAGRSSVGVRSLGYRVRLGGKGKGDRGGDIGIIRMTMQWRGEAAGKD